MFLFNSEVNIEVDFILSYTNVYLFVMYYIMDAIIHIYVVYQTCNSYTLKR